jgi:hypothetical protein
VTSATASSRPGSRRPTGSSSTRPTTRPPTTW